MQDLSTCYARLEASLLTVGNAGIERRWRLDAGKLFAVGFTDKTSGREWITAAATVPSLVGAALLASPSSVKLTRTRGKDGPVEADSLVAELAVDADTTYRFKIFPTALGVTMQLVASAGVAAVAALRSPNAASTEPTGIEIDPLPGTANSAAGESAVDVLDAFTFSPLHVRLTRVAFRDQTDRHNNLVFETEWLLNPAESAIRVAGDLFFLEDTLTGDGLIFVKHAPLPHARPVRNPIDLDLREGSATFFGHGIDDAGGAGYPFALLAYRGGRPGRIAALHDYQRQFRVYDAHRDGLFLSNTWGDRAKDGRINEPFVLAEIEAAARLGVDVVQIDDGWETGVTANSVKAGGVWNGYWAADDKFWEPHPQRFPNGLSRVVEAARGLGMQFGLWFGPDSSNDFANWSRDAEQILSIHRAHGVNYFKLDSIKIHSKLGERNLHRFIDAVLQESQGKVVFDHDVTAEIRPGYFGLMHAGPVFVENRYTDWHRYWPHNTLRNLWQLAQYVDPVRLRIEFLNHTRHVDQYAGDRLAPSCYSPAYLFATTMFASPLGWFEVSGLPPEYVAEVARLAEAWKRHRADIFGGRIIPIGQAPDGTSWTGFASSARDESSAHVLVFRELNPRAQRDIELPIVAGKPHTIERLGGDGSAVWADDRLRITLDKPLSFSWVRLLF